MKANELRIGNYVRYCDNNYQIQQIIKRNGKYALIFEYLYHGVWIDEVEKIEITEDVLLKCGFELIYDGYYIKELYLIQDIRFDFLINKQNFELSGLTYKGDTYYHNVRYLHELQNLYYAITKQELEVNL